MGTKRRPTKRPLSAPRPVKGKGTPLPAEARARLAFKLAQARGERADDLAAQLVEAKARPYPKGGAPTLSADRINEIRRVLRDVRRSNPDEKDYQVHEFVGRKCHVSPGSVRKYDPHPNRPRRRQ